ncbi:MAG: TolC family protein [Pseudomonadota bacterium]
MSFLFIARGRPVIVASLLFVLCRAAVAADTPLTLGEAQQRAVQQSRLLAAKDFSATAASEMALAAGRLPDPVLKFGVDNLPVDGPDRFSLTRDFMTQRRVGLMQELTRGDKLRSRAERFQREAEKSSAEKTATTATIQRDTALAWLYRYYAEAMAAVVADQAAQARLEIQAAEAAYRANRGGQADIIAARSALVAFDDRSSEIGRRVGNATVMLARWIGADAQRPLAGKPDTDSVHLDGATLDTQLGHHPAIAILGKQAEIAAADARLAQANTKADWSVELAFQQRGPAYANMLSLGVSVPLQWDRKNRQDREVSARLAQVEQANAERDDALRAHIAEVRSLLNEWHNNRERQARYQRELIPLAASRSTAELAAYRGGKASLAAVLAARRAEVDARLQALQLEADTARLWAQLNFLFPLDQASRAAPVSMHKDSK